MGNSLSQLLAASLMHAVFPKEYAGGYERVLNAHFPEN
jgi:hypothetical protein